MSTASPKRFINLLYWFFRIAYFLQLGAIILIVAFNYISFNGNGPYFTVRGTIHAYETGNTTNKFMAADSSTHLNATTFTNKYGVSKYDTLENSTIYYINGLRTGFMRIDYSDFNKAFTLKNIGWALCDILISILWLLVTYQVMKVLRSMKDRSAFASANIKRITIIGCIVLLVPFVEVMRDQLFYYIIQQHITIPGYQFYSNANWKDFLPPTYFFSDNGLGGPPHNRFPLIALGLIILAIAQIFKSGFELQSEKDLTI